MPWDFSGSPYGEESIYTLDIPHIFYFPPFSFFVTFLLIDTLLVDFTQSLIIYFLEKRED